MRTELFEDLETQQKSKRFHIALFPGRFLAFKVAYEDLVCGVLIFVLLLLGGFCLGVERGKQLAGFGRGGIVPVLVAQESQDVSEPTTAVPQADAETRFVQETLPAPVRRAVSEAPAAPQPAAEVGGREGYVIQLASYSGARTAQDESERLKRKGVRTRVIKQGRYFELRAVGFRSREEARVSLAALRKIYRDAFIKRVSSS